jgi:peptidoglycan/LPS O-acetylase OafA/YrhL
MRSKQLDILRVIAVLLVIGRHYDVHPLWYRMGWTGVNLFFVLSGFLISGLLFSEQKSHGRIRVGRFLVRRGFKIYPAFYLFIAWTAAFRALYGKGIPWGRLAAEIVFVQNYLPGLWPHTWSLAVEEHFYVALPLLLLLLRRRRGATDDPFRWIPWIYAAVALSCFALRVVALTGHPLEEGEVVGQTHLVVDALLLGVTISYFHHYHRDSYDRLVARVSPWLIPVGLVLIAPCGLPGAGSTPLRLSVEHLLLSWGFAAILVASIAWKPERSGRAGRLLRPVMGFLAYLGSHSYSVYLWHVAMAGWGLHFLREAGLAPQNRVLEFSIYLVMSFVIGVGMARLIEDPVLRVRDRFFPSRSQNPAAR